MESQTYSKSGNPTNITECELFHDSFLFDVEQFQLVNYNPIVKFKETKNSCTEWGHFAQGNFTTFHAVKFLQI